MISKIVYLFAILQTAQSVIAASRVRETLNHEFVRRQTLATSTGAPAAVATSSNNFFDIFEPFGPTSSAGSPTAGSGSQSSQAAESSGPASAAPSAASPNPAPPASSTGGAFIGGVPGGGPSPSLSAPISTGGAGAGPGSDPIPPGPPAGGGGGGVNEPGLLSLPPVPGPPSGGTGGSGLSLPGLPLLPGPPGGGGGGGRGRSGGPPSNGPPSGPPVGGGGGGSGGHEPDDNPTNSLSQDPSSTAPSSTGTGSSSASATSSALSSSSLPSSSSSSSGSACSLMATINPDFPFAWGTEGPLINSMTLSLTVSVTLMSESLAPTSTALNCMAVENPALDLGPDMVCSCPGGQYYSMLEAGQQNAGDGGCDFAITTPTPIPSSALTPASTPTQLTAAATSIYLGGAAVLGGDLPIGPTTAALFPGASPVGHNPPIDMGPNVKPTRIGRDNA